MAFILTINQSITNTHCIAVSHCIVPLCCTTALCCTVPSYCTTVLHHCAVPLHCATVLHCTTAEPDATYTSAIVVQALHGRHSANTSLRLSLFFRTSPHLLPPTPPPAAHAAAPTRPAASGAPNVVSLHTEQCGQWYAAGRRWGRRGSSARTAAGGRRDPAQIGALARRKFLSCSSLSCR